MNFTTQNAKNLVSKDNELSKKTAQDVVDSCDFETFKTLCENSEHIFDFIMEKIIRNLSQATNKNNIASTLEFAKIYDSQLSHYIVKSWLKYANEDLTDDILDIFENGNIEQKIHAAKYFEKINDPLALEYLNKHAFDEDEILSSSCATALAAFGDNTSRSKAYEMLKSDDDFTQFSAIKFLINYGAKEDLPLIIGKLSDSVLSANIAQELLYKYHPDELDNLLSSEEVNTLYDEIISAYPEDISLETIYGFNIFSFCEKRLDKKSSFDSRILTDVKTLVQLVSHENIYTFDLSKDAICELKNLDNLLKRYNPNAEVISQELFKNSKRAIRAINAIINLDAKNESDKIAQLYHTTQNPTVMCECARAAMVLGFKLELEAGLSKIEDSNIQELLKSYF